MPPVVLASTIGGVNRLPNPEKQAAYSLLIPPELTERFSIPPTFQDIQGRPLLDLHCPPDSHVAEMALYHRFGFEDPVLYGQISDTLNGQVHVLLYVLNDPDSPRFDVDRLPDGRLTRFGTTARNCAAELAAMQAGLSPGQVRTGLRLLGPAIIAFECFVISLGHDLYFVEPLYYHNAVIFERYGFAYQRGRRLMERIQGGFDPAGDLRQRLDNSSPFRLPAAADSIRLRSWAIHDGLLGEPFTDVTMYKQIGRSAGILTCPGCGW